MIYGLNDKIGTELFPKDVEDVRTQGGMKSIVRDVLVPLKVVYGSFEKGVFAGDTVYVNVDQKRQTWATNPVKINDREVMIVPFSVIQFVESRAAEKWKPEATPLPKLSSLD